MHCYEEDCSTIQDNPEKKQNSLVNQSHRYIDSTDDNSYACKIDKKQMYIQLKAMIFSSRNSTRWYPMHNFKYKQCNKLDAASGNLKGLYNPYREATSKFIFLLFFDLFIFSFRQVASSKFMKLTLSKNPIQLRYA